MATRHSPAKHAPDDARRAIGRIPSSGAAGFVGAEPPQRRPAVKWRCAAAFGTPAPGAPAMHRRSPEEGRGWGDGATVAGAECEESRRARRTRNGRREGHQMPGTLNWMSPHTLRRQSSPADCLFAFGLPDLRALRWGASGLWRLICCGARTKRHPSGGAAPHREGDALSSSVDSTEDAARCSATPPQGTQDQMYAEMAYLGQNIASLCLPPSGVLEIIQHPPTHFEGGN